MSNTATILYCNCAYYDIVPQSAKSRVIKAIKDSDLAVEAVTDLCKVAASDGSKLQYWAGLDNLTIVACYPRAVRWLFHRAGAALKQDNTRFLNMRTQNPDEIIESLLTDDTKTQGRKDIQLEKNGQWIPWFPVIDYDRCKNCKQCMNFCLFGVFGLNEEGLVQVQKPANCKTNCPACARVCPEAAIIFPKYHASPINGDEVDEQAFQKEKTKVDLSRLMKGDIHKAIRQRDKNHKRFAKNGTKQQPSLNFSQLQNELNIPSEVLASITPDEMAQINAKVKKKCQNSNCCQDDCDDKPENKSSD